HDEDDAEADPGPQAAADARLHYRLDQKLQSDVAALGAQRAADADLARPLRHGRQHDVHDTDAADEQRDAGDENQQHLVATLGPSGLRQPVQRHGDGPVVLGVHLEDGTDNVAGRPDLVDVRDGQGDLGQFGLLADHGAGLPSRDGLAVASPAGAQGDVDVL